MTRTHHSDILGMALDFDRAKGEIMITTTFIKTMKKFVDESGVIWTAVIFLDKSVWIRVEEADSDFENAFENGYSYKNMKECLKDMQQSYGILKEFKEKE